MPRTDVNDNRAMHNIQGIDLRKNADSNSAEDMVNVWFNSQHYFTNRPMPSLYKVGQTTFNGNYKFACECKNLAGSEVEIDITSAEGVPTASGVQEATDDSGEIWITGSNLETVREVLWVSESGGVLVSGTDFSFYYDREHNRLAICPLEGKEDLDTSQYIYFVLISPYGQTSTQYAGLVPDYYFGSHDEYRLRTEVSSDGYPLLVIEAKKADGSYQRIERWVDYSFKVDREPKHYSVHLGSSMLIFDMEMSSNAAVFQTETVGGQVVLQLVFVGGKVCQWSGAVTRDDAVSGQQIMLDGDLMLGALVADSDTDRRFRFSCDGTGITLADYTGTIYKTITTFTTV